MRRSVLLATLCLLIGLAPGESHAALVTATSNGIDFSVVAEKAIPAVVSITVEADSQSVGQGGQQRFQNPYEFFNDDFFRRFFGQRPRQQQQRPRVLQGQGSGFIVSEDGYILTNNHVVEGAERIRVALQDGRELPGKIVGRDSSTDLAVLKIEAEELPYLELANSDEAKVGQWVCAIGNPLGLEATVTVGVLSAKGRRNLRITDFEDFLQTDASINRGNSGGPLLNTEARVVGINTAIAITGSGGPQGIGFAIPSSMARLIMDQLIETGDVIRGYLGVQMQMVTEETAEWLGFDRPMGVIIADVLPGSPAEAAGLRPGDLVKRLNQEPILDMIDLRNRIKLSPPGSRIRLEVMRNEETLNIDVTIGEVPRDALVDHSPGRLMGIEVQTMTPEMARAAGYEEGAGILISKVLSDTAAEEAGLRPGDLVVALNQQRVRTAEEFYALLNSANRGDRLLLQVQRGQLKRTISMTVR